MKRGNDAKTCECEYEWRAFEFNEDEQKLFEMNSTYKYMQFAHFYSKSNGVKEIGRESEREVKFFCCNSLTLKEAEAIKHIKRSSENILQ